MDIKNINNFDYSIIADAPLQKRRKGNQGRRNNIRKYKDLFCAFDIETTNDLSLNQAYMYIWQYQIEDYTIIGRTWDEFKIFCDRIVQQLKPNEFLMVYIHNAAFEFSFLRGIYHFEQE